MTSPTHSPDFRCRFCGMSPDGIWRAITPDGSTPTCNHVFVDINRYDQLRAALWPDIDRSLRWMHTNGPYRISGPDDVIQLFITLEQEHPGSMTKFAELITLASDEMNLNRAATPNGPITDTPEDY